MNNNNLEQWQNETNRTYSNDIDQLINHSIKKAKHDTFVHRIKMFSMILFLPLALFVTLVNTSQEFVSAINDVPILGNLANILNYNPSIYYARNTEYFQRIDQTFETDDYKLYVESMIVDEDMAVLFYKVKLKTQEHHFESWKFNNYQNQTSIFPSGISKDPNELQYVQFNPKENIADNTFEFEFSLDDNSDPREITRFTVENDLSKLAQPQTFVLNKTIEFEGQKITLKQIDIYPMSTNITVSQDKKNTFKIFNYLFAFYDKEGKRIEGIHNGVSGQKIDDFSETVKLEAPYGLENELTLVLEEVRWIEKEGSDIIFDPVKKEIQNLPNNLTLDYFDEEKITFKPVLNSNETSKDRIYTFDDATGAISAVNTSGSERWIIVPFTAFKKNDKQMLVLKNTYGKMHQLNLNITTINLDK